MLYYNGLPHTFARQLISTQFFVSLVMLLFLTGCNQADFKYASSDSASDTNFLGDSNLSLKVFLGGAYDTGTQKLKTDLNSLNRLPIVSPYGPDLNRGVSTSAAPSVGAGFFALNPTIVDWVHIEIRSGMSSSTSILKKSVFVDEDGILCDLDGAQGVALNVVSGNYFVVIRHRNHLAAMTRNLIQTADSPTLVDLTQSATSVLALADGSDGGLMDTFDGNFSMVPGDINQDGTIEFAVEENLIRLDVINSIGNISNSTNYNFHVGYLDVDIDFDGKGKYTAPNDDIFILQTSIYLSPANTTFSLGYIIEQNLNI